MTEHEINCPLCGGSGIMVKTTYPVEKTTMWTLVKLVASWTVLLVAFVWCLYMAVKR